MKLSDLFDDAINGGKKPNLLFLMTDQERYSKNFAAHHLPAMTRLENTGITFTHAFTPTCMCSPSRATFLTSQYPSLHGVTSTGSPQPKHTLPTNIPNLATVLKRAGYNIIEWQGKWHLGNTPSDYGFTGWNPPDAGNYLVINDTLGGGTPNNDGRFLENVLSFLQKQHEQDSTEPWCLIVSFVNPHDVYVSQYNVEDAGYSKDDLQRIQVTLPDNHNEDLPANNKPRAQESMSWNHVHHESSMQQYVNFYAYLHTIVDAHIFKILERLDEYEMTNDTVIFRFADHGEQALSHGLVEKFFNAYEESIRIPLIVSNPRVYQEATRSDALVSLLDLVPTTADLCGVQEEEFDECFYGKSFVSLLNHSTATEVECDEDDNEEEEDEVIHFTYDDIECPNAPSKIRCIRTRQYKYAVYFDKDGSDGDWELYDLFEDPNEDNNLAGKQEYASIQFVLDETLQCNMRDYKTLPALFDWPPTQTKDSRGGPPPPQLTVS